MEAHFLCLQQPGEPCKQHRLQSETQIVLELCCRMVVGQAQNIPSCLRNVQQLVGHWLAPLPACSHITLAPGTGSKSLLAAALLRCAGDLVQQQEMVCHQSGMRVGLYQKH